MALIDRQTIEQDTSDNPYLGKSPQELDMLRKSVEGQLAQRRKDALIGNIQGGMRTVGDVFLQKGGIKPVENKGNDLNDYIMKEMIKSKLNPPTWKPTTRDEALAFEKEKSQNSIAAQKFAQQQGEAQKKNELYSQGVQDAASDALSTIGEVEKGINYFGLTGGLPSIPGTPRAKWEANIGKLLSGKVIDVMTKMKEASKTGATGFGQLSEKELKVLQEASTALNRSLSSKDAQEILSNMKVKLQRIATPNIPTSVGQGGQVGMIPTSAGTSQPTGFRIISKTPIGS